MMNYRFINVKYKSLKTYTDTILVKITQDLSILEMIHIPPLIPKMRAFKFLPLVPIYTNIVQGFTNGTSGTIGNDRWLSIMQTIYSVGKISSA